MKRVLVAAVALSLSLAGCSSRETGLGASSPTTTTATTTTAPPARIPGVEGRFLSLAGEDLFDTGLYELRLWPLRLEPLTPVRRVSTIGACRTQVVVAAAQAEVGYIDRLQRFSAGRFGPVEGLGTPHAFYPTFAPDCRMLYLDNPEPGEGDVRLHLWDPDKRTDTVIASFPGVGGLWWGPGGRIAVVERTRSTPGVEDEDVAVHILENGTRRSFPPPEPGLTDLYWGASNWMAFGRRPVDGTIFLEPDTGERHDLAGWVPRAWSPDGTKLLVASGGDLRRLGIVELPDFAAVAPLGEAPFAVRDTLWLPPGSDPIGTAPTD